MIGLYCLFGLGSLACVFIFRLFHKKKSFSLSKGERYLTLEDIKKQAEAKQ